MSQPLLTESSEKTKQQVGQRQSTLDSAGSLTSQANPILQLQRTLGNQCVAQLIKAKRLTPQGKISPLQPKLTVGAADDQYEQEADRIARQVVSMPDSVAVPSAQQSPHVEGEAGPAPAHVLQSKPLPLAASITPFVQQQTENNEEPEDNETPLQAKLSPERGSKGLQRQTLTEEEAKEEETGPIQTKTATPLSGSFEAGADVESRLSQSKGQGSPLPDPVRSYMEPRFGVDFSHVRTHTGSNSAEMNREVGAQAFTHGSDIYYGAGGNPGNLELTAHELTHVMQQAGHIPLQTKCPDDAPRLNLEHFPEPNLRTDASDNTKQTKSASNSSVQLSRRLATHGTHRSSTPESGSNILPPVASPLAQTTAPPASPEARMVSCPRTASPQTQPSRLHSVQRKGDTFIQKQEEEPSENADAEPAEGDTPTPHVRIELPLPMIIRVNGVMYTSPTFLLEGPNGRILDLAPYTGNGFLDFSLAALESLGIPLLSFYHFHFGRARRYLGRHFESAYALSGGTSFIRNALHYGYITAGDVNLFGAPSSFNLEHYGGIPQLSIVANPRDIGTMINVSYFNYPLFEGHNNPAVLFSINMPFHQNPFEAFMNLGGAMYHALSGDLYNLPGVTHSYPRFHEEPIGAIGSPSTRTQVSPKAESGP